MIINTDVHTVSGRELHDDVPLSAKKLQEPSRDNPDPVNLIFNRQLKPGTAADRFVLTERLLSRHLMLVGGIGSGKTNLFDLILRDLIPKLSKNDVMIIFDTKGDFQKEFYAPGDIVISNDSTATGGAGPDYWNIINELEDDGHLIENCIEISNALFAESIKHSNESFFPKAAKDIVSAVLYHFAKVRGRIKVDNSVVSDCFKKNNLQEWLLALLGNYAQFESMKCYIANNVPEQALGVISEIQQVIRQVLIGNFAKKGTLSIRDLVRKKGGRKVFIEYDIGVGGMLTPIYSLLFDLAIKEALCRAKSEGNVYFICDEFKLLPNLAHIDDAVNFGRSLGIKFMVGMQNVDQIINAYNEHMAKNIFSGFLNQIAFKVSDYSTRQYVKERAGSNRKFTLARSVNAQPYLENANVIEDWDMDALEPGEAIVMLDGSEPFRFMFEEYKSGGQRV